MRISIRGIIGVKCRALIIAYTVLGLLIIISIIYPQTNGFDRFFWVLCCLHAMSGGPLRVFFDLGFRVVVISGAISWIIIFRTYIRGTYNPHLQLPMNLQVGLRIVGL